MDVITRKRFYYLGTMKHQPSKSNEEIIEKFDRKLWRYAKGELEREDCKDWLLTILETKDKERERAVGESFSKDLRNSFNCLLIWWFNGFAFGLGFLTVKQLVGILFNHT